MTEIFVENPILVEVYFRRSQTLEYFFLFSPGYRRQLRNRAAIILNYRGVVSQNSALVFIH